MNTAHRWLVRVLDTDGRTAGTGFAVDAEHVVTCAHLAQKRFDGARIPVVGPGREVRLDFLFDNQEVMATVVHDGWHPERPDGSGDLAVLRLTTPLPDLVSAPLRRLTSLAGREVELSGFPDQLPVARTARGVLSNHSRPEWVQIDPAGTGWSVELGFSGGPVWDPELGAVVGMTVARDGHRTGHMLTLDYLCELWPPLANRIPVPPARAVDEGHWWSRFRGVTAESESGWLFRGRERALGTIADWLNGTGDLHRILVVTGAPGAGKSTVLSRIVITSHRPWIERLPASDSEFRAKPGSVRCAVHAAGKTALEIASEILASVDPVPLASLDDFPRLIASLLRDSERFGVVVDALDETIDPHEARLVITRVLRPLAGMPQCRVVVGSRRFDTDGDLLEYFGRGLRRIDLDDAEHFDIDDLTAYAFAALRQASAEQTADPYGDTAIAAELAERIAAMSDRNFLVAGLVARSHGRFDTVAIAASELRFSTDVGIAFWDFLDRLDPINGVSAADVLTALAYAETPGFTPELWAAALEALDGHSIDPRRLARFAVSDAANFLIEAVGPEDKTFRIFHQALIDACLRRRARWENQEASEAALTGTFWNLARARGWEAGPVYLRRSLAGHARRAGMIGELLADPEFLVSAEPERLLRALEDETSQATALHRAIYHACSGRSLLAGPRERRAILADMASRFGALDLARKIAAPDTGELLSWQPVWSTGSGVDPRIRAMFKSGGDDHIQGLACAAVDGRAIALTASNRGVVRTWDVATGRMRSEVLLDVNGQVNTAACVSVGGETFVVTSGYLTAALQVWNLATGALTRTIDTGLKHTVSDLVCTHLDGRAVAVTGGGDGLFRIWDLEAGQLLRTLPTRAPVSRRSLACTVVGGEKAVVLRDRDRKLKVISLTDGRLLGELDIGLGTGGFALAEVDGVSVAVAPGWVPDTRPHQEDLHLWFLDGSERVIKHRIDGMVGDVACGQIDGTPIALLLMSDGRVRILDLTSGRDWCEPYDGHTNSGHLAVVTTVNGVPTALTGELGGPVQVWDIRPASTSHRIIEGHDRWVSGAAFNVLGSRPVAVTSSDQGTVKWWDLESGTHLGTWSSRYGGKKGAIGSATVRGVPVLVSAVGLRAPHVYELVSGQEFHQKLQGHSDLNSPASTATCLEFNGSAFAIAGQGVRRVRVWDLSSGQELRWPLEQARHTGVIVAIAAAVVEDRPITLVGLRNDLEYGVHAWDLLTGQHYGVALPVNGTHLKAVGLAEIDGKPMAAIALPQGVVEIWDLAVGDRLVSIPFPESVSSVALNNEGWLLVGSGRDVAALRYWSSTG